MSDVGAGVPDHDGAADVAAGLQHGAPQHLGVRLLHPEGVLAADRFKARGHPQCIEQQARQAFELVGADREAAAFGGEPVERALQARKRPRAVGDVGGVVLDEIGEHPVELGGRERAAARAIRPSSIMRRAPPPIMLRACVVRQRRQALAREHDVQRVDQIGRGVDQGAVEIEDDGEVRPCFSAILAGGTRLDRRVA